LSSKWDVIVVGAGCAGPAAAKRAAEKGLKTILLEKARKPGDKNVSGTNLNTLAINMPELHYLVDGPFEREFNTLRVNYILDDRTTAVEESYDGNIALAIRRDIFDDWHAKTALQAGADLRLSTAVTDVLRENGKVIGVVTDKGEKIRGEVIIDAGGVNSIVGRKAGLIKRRAGPSMILYATVNVSLTKELVDERWGSSFEYYLSPGICHKAWPWIFPKKDSVTLGTGGYMTSEIEDVNQYMQNFLNLQLVQKKLSGGKIRSWGLHLVTDELLEKNCTDRLILTGDAGGFVTPFLGEGMPEAFRSGIYAADTAVKAIDVGDTSETFLKTTYNDLCSSDTYMESFRHIASLQKEAILNSSEKDLTVLMQDVVMGGGFITNYIHTKWVEAAKEEDMEKLLLAYTYLQFLAPYRDFGNAKREEFKEIWKKRKVKK
jgi:electron transfer flavoprotein-quinone oxidoreductase